MRENWTFFDVIYSDKLIRKAAWYVMVRGVISRSYKTKEKKQGCWMSSLHTVYHSPLQSSQKSQLSVRAFCPWLIICSIRKEQLLLPASPKIMQRTTWRRECHMHKEKHPVSIPERSGGRLGRLTRRKLWKDDEKKGRMRLERIKIKIQKDSAHAISSPHHFCNNPFHWQICRASGMIIAKNIVIIFKGAVCNF